MITRILLLSHLLISLVTAFVPTQHHHHVHHNVRLVFSRPMTPSNETSTESFTDSDDSPVSLHVPNRKNFVPSLETSGHVRTIHSTHDFVQYLDAQPKDTLCVVKYHANYCKICSRTILKYKKMACTFVNSIVYYYAVLESILDSHVL